MTTSLPCVGRPPFSFKVEGPDDWDVLETTPQRWQISLERFLDRLTHSDDAATAAAARTYRPGLEDLLESVIRGAQQAGTALCLLRFGIDKDRQPFSASLTLSFVNTSPLPASTTLTLEAFATPAPGRDVDELDLPDRDPAVMVTTTTAYDETLIGLFGHDGASVTAQAYVPMPGTTWTAVLTGTSSRSEHASLMQSLAARMAHTLHRTDQMETATGAAPRT